MARVWDAFLTERDKQVFGAAGYGSEASFKDRPALLIIDINIAFVGDRREPILDSIARFPNSCGEEGWQAMERLQPVLAAARQQSLPIFYTTGDDAHLFLDQQSWGAKNRRISQWRSSGEQTRTQANAIHDMVAPQAGEVIITKKKPSPFFGTPLMQYLVTLGVNQLLCCGTTTGGCVRAAVIDAFSYGYRVAVIEECTFDRGQASHAINLFDMNQKYADVISDTTVISYIQSLPDDLFPDWMTAVAAGAQARI